VSAELPDGTPVLIHPLRASDREDFIAAYENLSLRSLENRFFSGGQPPRSLIEYLLQLDYVNHFAWVVIDPAAPEGGLAEARYVRLGASPDTADIALTVTDPYQGRGIGTLLMGALAAAAGEAGIQRFSADVRGENAAMLRLMKKADATLGRYEQGVVNGIMSVDRVATMVPDQLRRQLQRVASELVAAAGLGLV
jgi:RimJ/RimL family protein N-acetyltransferase